MNPGIYPSLSNQAYHEEPGFSSSGIKAFLNSPAHYKAYIEQEIEETDALRIGSAVHSAVLEPETVEDAVAVLPKLNLRTKAGKAERDEFLAAHPTHTIVKADEWELIKEIKTSVWSHPAARRLLEMPGKAEVSYIAEHEGDVFKARPDRLTDSGIVIDFKTARDASPHAFTGACAKLHYHVQEAWYRDVMGMLGTEVQAFVFIAVEKKPPYGVGVYMLDASDVSLGRNLCAKALDGIKQCQALNHWPCYSEKIERIELPEWAYREDVEND